jgi:cytochrome c553
MSHAFRCILSAAFFASSSFRGVANAADPPPAWAYGFQWSAAEAASHPAPPPAARSTDTSLKQLPGSTLSVTRAQISDAFGPADWYPSDHPQMPDVVAHGRRPDVRACSLCHYPNGKGRPENAGVAGLPVNYFIETMHEFRDGQRSSADKRKANTNVMIAIAKGMTEEEIKQVAEYFAQMKWTPWIKVVETNSVPKTYTSVGMFLPVENSTEKEPLGDRIIETPVDPEGTEILRNPRSGFIAYVPPGRRKGWSGFAKNRALPHRATTTR